MSESKFNVDYFIEKLGKVPTEKWIARQLQREEDCGCVQFHCGVRYKIGPRGSAQGYAQTDESDALGELLRPILPDALRPHQEINDLGWIAGLLQPTPKERIMAALAVIKSQTV
jgi:hypothetical protein